MSTASNHLNNNQLLFKELFVGTLIYAIVLGFFNDYTSLVDATSFSYIFFASIVLETLTYLAFLLKKAVVAWLRQYDGVPFRVAMFFSVWLIMFLSKFVFVWVVDLIFGNNININGFFGVLALVLCVTVLHKLADYVFIKLGDPSPK